MKEDGTVLCPYGGDDVLKIVLSKVELLLFDISDGFIRRQGLLNPLVEVSQIHRRRVSYIWSISHSSLLPGFYFS